MNRTVTVHHDDPGGRTRPVGDVTFTSNDAGMLVATTFAYHRDWLVDGYALCPELPLIAGQQAQSGTRLVPGAIADTGPDRWGQNLLFAAERRAAKRERRRIRTLNEADFVLLAHDRTRQGALRFSQDGGTSFISPQTDGVPTLVDLDALVAAADRQARDRGTDADLELLTRAGTSMGGARPKVTVVTAEGRLALAKLPSRDDTWDVQAWEATALELARRAGLPVPHFTLHRVDEDRSVLVLDRFDRTCDERRVGYMSAHTLMEKTPNVTVSYVELADVLGDHSADPAADRTDLFRRVVFTLLVNNVDDHLKNHGLLRAPNGWRLSPAFDINPFPAGRPVDSTPIVPGGSGATRDIDELVAHAAYFGLTHDAAAAVVAQVADATATWAETAEGLGIADPEDGAVASAFDTASRDQAEALARVSAVEPFALGPDRDGGVHWVKPHLRGGRPVRGHARRPRA